MLNLSTYTEYLAAISSTLFGKLVRSILAGSMGVVILVIFLATILHPATLSKLLPLIIVFNTALTGYMVIDQTRDDIKHRRTLAVISGIAAMLSAALVLNILFIKTVGYSLIAFGDLPLLLISSTIAGGLGGMLAIKYFSLNPQH
jgi:hypothetical protein